MYFLSIWFSSNASSKPFLSFYPSCLLLITLPVPPFLYHHSCTTIPVPPFLYHHSCTTIPVPLFLRRGCPGRAVRPNLPILGCMLDGFKCNKVTVVFS